MSLTTLSNVKLYLGITDSSQDGLLNLLITSTSSAIEQYCDRSFGTASFTEFYSGSGKVHLILNQRPVTAVTSIYLDNAGYWGQGSLPFAAGTLLTAGTDYALVVDQPDGASRCGLVYRVNGAWDAPLGYTAGIITPTSSNGQGNIKVVYSAGYATIPSQIEEACCLAITNLSKTAAYGQAIESESYENYSIAFAPTSLLKKHIFGSEVRSLLAPFRNLAIA